MFISISAATTLDDVKELTEIAHAAGSRRDIYINETPMMEQDHFKLRRDVTYLTRMTGQRSTTCSTIWMTSATTRL